jgi:hypothetical protein
LLESLLEQSTSDDPEQRPSMREVAQELAWWSEPSVSPRTDLTEFVDQVDRIRRATAGTRQKTPQRIEELYSEAGSRVYSELTTPIGSAITQAGLVQVDCIPRDLAGWPPPNYGGSANRPCWGIETLASPWLATSIGVVHRAQPVNDLEDLAVTLVLALMTPVSQHNYIEAFERFEPGSLQLDRIVSWLKSQVLGELPEILAHFLSECGRNGVPR